MSSNKKKNKNKKKSSINLTSEDLTNETQSNETQSNETQSNDESELPIIEVIPPEELVISEETSIDVTNTEFSFKQIIENVGDELEKSAINETKNLLNEVTKNKHSENETLQEVIQDEIIDVGKEVIHKISDDIGKEVEKVKKQSTQLKIALLKKRK